jgi:cytochrome c oxidase assembly protein subunit 15
VAVWSVRVLLPVAALTIVAGTAATAAGPHSGGVTGQHVHRLHFKGADTLTWVVHQHATIAAVFGVLVIGVWFLLRRRGAGERTLEPVTILAVLLAAQGLVGSVQYEMALPAEMVWVHITLAVVTWLVVLWAVAAQGRLVPRVAPVPLAEPRAAGRELESVR